MNTSDRERMELWFELLARYQHMEPKKMLPLVAVRLLCTKHGLDGVLAALKRDGEDYVTKFAQQQLSDMAHLWVRTIRANPPPQNLHAAVMAGAHQTYDASKDSGCAERIFKQLSRLRIREDALRQARAAKAAEPKPPRVPPMTMPRFKL